MPPASPVRMKYANTLRSISSSFHNNAATLLNGGKEAASTPFWRKAAEIGEEALILRDKAAADGLVNKNGGGDDVESAKDNEAWMLLREKYIVSRWELLGYALGRSGERKVCIEILSPALETSLNGVCYSHRRLMKPTFALLLLDPSPCTSVSPTIRL